MTRPTEDIAAGIEKCENAAETGQHRTRYQDRNRADGSGSGSHRVRLLKHRCRRLMPSGGTE